MKRINRRIARLEKDLGRVDSGHSPTHRMLATVVFLALILGVGLFSMDSALTGYVTFGESFSDIQQYTGTSMFVEESGMREIIINRSGINALTVSGSIFGKGKAAIYLEKDEKRRLVYYFVGDAGDGFNFTNECSETCYLEDLAQPNNLIFELEGTKVNISDIGFMYHTLIDFDLTPKMTTMNYSEETRKKVVYTLTNKEDEAFALLVYIEGPLNDSITLDDTWASFTLGKAKETITVDIELPLGLEPGRYENRIIARYVPRPGTPFKGATPISIGQISIVKEGPVLHTPRPIISMVLVIALVVLFLVNYCIYFFRFRKGR